MKNYSISFSIIIIISLTLFILNIIFVINYNIQTNIKKSLSSASMILFIRPGTPSNEINFLRNRITENNKVRNIIFISSEELINYYKSNFYNLPDIISNLPTEPVGSIIRVYLKNPSIENFESVQKEFNNISLIDEIVYGKESITKLNNMLDNFQTYYGIINFIIIFASIIILICAYNLNYSSCENDFKIIKLSGVSNLFFQIDILKPVIIQGLLSALLSILFTVVPTIIILKLNPNLSIFNIKINYPNLQIISTLFIIGIMLSIISSFISLKKYDA